MSTNDWKTYLKVLKYSNMDIWEKMIYILLGFFSLYYIYPYVSLFLSVNIIDMAKLIKCEFLNV